MEASWIFPSVSDINPHLEQMGGSNTASQDLSRRQTLIPLAFQCARALSLPRHTAHLAAILTHRLLLTLPAWPSSLQLCTAILLATKSDETPRKAADICRAVSSQLASDAPLAESRLLEMEPTALAKTGFDFCVDTAPRHVLRGVQANVVGEDGGEVVEVALQVAEKAMAGYAPLLFKMRVLAAASVIRACQLVGAECKGDADWRCEPDQVKACLKVI